MKLKIKKAYIVYLGITSCLLYLLASVLLALQLFSSFSSLARLLLSLLSAVLSLALGLFCLSLEFRVSSAVETWFALAHTYAGKALLHLLLYLGVAPAGGVFTSLTGGVATAASFFLALSTALFAVQAARFGLDRQTLVMRGGGLGDAHTIAGESTVGGSTVASSAGTEL
ncbi:hypothetical protein TeGR_g12373 [Tetraparma gracilis]|uniref:Uncharacterized protein n=1 Tax=Tetraparma gracilis TaxID=2962635 RepID=A0ABQ6MY29_9STRA|nr:hypothetical protein TeGR_g12373 [Tetraparma gracilis]